MIILLSALAALLVVAWWREYNARRNHIEAPAPPTTGLQSPVLPETVIPIPNPPNVENTAHAPPQPTTGTSHDGDHADAMAPDGNSIDDMMVGDAGIFGAKSVPSANKPTKGTPASMIALGKTLMGTPYVYGAPRSDSLNKSFDCSAYTRYLYSVGRGMSIGMDSRVQQQYVKAHGAHRWSDWRKSSPGDLIFFGPYRGNKKSDYADFKRGVTVISHVGIYLGKDKAGKHLLLHTASAPTGVRIQAMDNTHLQYRVLYSGRPY